MPRFVIVKVLGIAYNFYMLKGIMLEKTREIWTTS